MELEHFINHGYGWMCRHCLAEEEAAGAAQALERARFFTEGEAETKELALSTPALARWRDAARQTLYCLRCGVEETVSKS